jgi:hypothetical protein
MPGMAGITASERGSDEMKWDLRRLLTVGLILMSIGLMAGGAYALNQSFTGRNEAKDKLVAEKIVTTEDADIPNTLVTNHETAHAMADVIQKHALESTGGLTYAELGRFMSAADPDDPAGTSDEAAALKDENGRPVSNPLRQVSLQAVTLRSALLSSALAFHLADLGMGVGLFLIAAGFLGLGFLWLLRLSLIQRVPRPKTDA